MTTPTPVLTKEQLRQAFLTPRAPPFRDVFIEQLGGTVRVIGMTGAQRDHWEASSVRVENGQPVQHQENQRARFLVQCLADPADGVRLFKDEEAPALGFVPAEILDPLVVLAAELSGLGTTLAKLKGNS